ncbi:MAG: hypothetical protein K8T90_01160 [Planctomycetes bacterium]|nr:hypothetical protein [Planctomycetota bacterium]
MTDARTITQSFESPLVGASAPDAASAPWERVISLCDDGVAERAFDRVTPATLGDFALAPTWRLRADGATDRAAALAAVTGDVLLVTSIDLVLPDIAWVLGYANRRRRAAVVSIARLRDPLDDELTIRRLRNVAAHESGHLRGLSHCRAPACVMRVATGPDVLDQRDDGPCAACRRRLDRRATWARRLGRLLPGRTNR